MCVCVCDGYFPSIAQTRIYNICKKLRVVLTLFNSDQVGAELRIPVKNTHVYAFVEHGNDLGSSKDVRGNPTEFFRRVGHGSSYGIGAKLGSVRVEYAVDHNAGKGAVFFRFGERY